MKFMFIYQEWTSFLPSCTFFALTLLLSCRIWKIQDTGGAMKKLEKRKYHKKLMKKNQYFFFRFVFFSSVDFKNYKPSLRRRRWNGYISFETSEWWAYLIGSRILKNYGPELRSLDMWSLPSISDDYREYLLNNPIKLYWVKQHQQFHFQNYNP